MTPLEVSQIANRFDRAVSSGRPEDKTATLAIELMKLQQENAKQHNEIALLRQESKTHDVLLQQMADRVTRLEVYK